MDMIDTELVSTIGRLSKKNLLKGKNKEWFIDANIQVAYGYFSLKAPLPG